MNSMLENRKSLLELAPEYLCIFFKTEAAYESMFTQALIVHNEIFFSVIKEDEVLSFVG